MSTVKKSSPKLRRPTRVARFTGRLTPVQELELLREAARTEDRSPEACMARLLAAGFVVRDGVIRVDTSK